MNTVGERLRSANAFQGCAADPIYPWSDAVNGLVGPASLDKTTAEHRPDVLPHDALTVTSTAFWAHLEDDPCGLLSLLPGADGLALGPVSEVCAVLAV